MLVPVGERGEAVGLRKGLETTSSAFSGGVCSESLAASSVGKRWTEVISLSAKLTRRAVFFAGATVSFSVSVLPEGSMIICSCKLQELLLLSLSKIIQMFRLGIFAGK